jgi:hypothetical protein
MCQQQCDQRIGYAAGLRPGNMSQIGARSAYLALRDFDPANVSCGSFLEVDARLGEVCFAPISGLPQSSLSGPKSAKALNRCAIVRCAGSPTASTVAGVKIVDSARVALS